MPRQQHPLLWKSGPGRNKVRSRYIMYIGTVYERALTIARGQEIGSWTICKNQKFPTDTVGLYSIGLYSNCPTTGNRAGWCAREETCDQCEVSANAMPMIRTDATPTPSTTQTQIGMDGSRGR